MSARRLRSLRGELEHGFDAGPGNKRGTGHRRHVRRRRRVVRHVRGVRVPDERPRLRRDRGAGRPIVAGRPRRSRRRPPGAGARQAAPGRRSAAVDTPRSAAVDGVRQEHRDRHRPDAARHRRDGAGDLRHRAEVDVADQIARRAAGSPRRPPRRRPACTMSAVTVPGRPAATTRISARRVCAPTSRVPVWQSVTVAFARGAFCESMIASGMPDQGSAPDDHHLGVARS